MVIYMAVNKYMRAALKTLSSIDVDLKSNYKLIRQVERIVRKPKIKLTYKTWDLHVNNNGYDIPIRVFTPGFRKSNESIETTSPVIVFFHGGGWITGDLDSYEKLCLTISRKTGQVLIAVDYRLAPEYPFPTALEDCYHAINAVMNWKRMSGNVNGITLMGDSAGGNLAAAVSLYMRDKGEQTADRQILIYPSVYYDHTESSPYPSVTENGTEYLLTSKRICDYMDLYCPNHADRHSAYFAPLLADDFSNQPDTLIITAEYDPLRDEGEAYGQMLKEAGNRVAVHRIADAIHGYLTLSARFSAVKESFMLINEFLREEKHNE